MNTEKTTDAVISKLGRNCLGTTDIYMKLPNMRKEQSFCVYPIQRNDSAKIIKIQSETRWAVIDLNSGKGEMSKSNSNGSNSVSFMLNQIRKETTFFTLTETDVNRLKMEIFGTTNAMAGTNGVMYCDNSGAVNIL